MEGAQALEGSATGIAQRDVGADHFLDPSAVPDGDDVLVVDPSWHAGIVCSPTDAGGEVLKYDVSLAVATSSFVGTWLRIEQ